RELILSETTGTPVHIAHVSLSLSVELIRHAKARGVPVTCETCPHYFTLTDEACDGFNTLAKVNPPLAGREDVEAIIMGLSDGTIDMIATDHAPHHKDEKDCEFAQAANGLIGFESAFPLAYTHLIRTGILTLPQLIQKMSLNPSRFLKLQKGILAPGNAADLIVADLETPYVLDVARFHSKSKNTPFHGYPVYGRILGTFTGGRQVYVFSEEGGFACCS
ncbi:MAG TPA: dihydroorotase, partial [Clostridiales bacterium]|nr:dihydroorotase [Clostridiales bacterium]